MQRDDIVGRKGGMQEGQGCYEEGRQACRQEGMLGRQAGMHAKRHAGRQEGRKPCKEAIASRRAGGRQEGRQAGGGYRYTVLCYIVRYVQSRAEGARAATDLILSVRVPYVQVRATTQHDSIMSY